MFTYIKPEFMIQAFKQQRDTMFAGRRICVARLGSFAVSMEKIDINSFALSLENVSTGAQHLGRIFNIKAITQEEATPVIEQMFHKMQTLNEKEIFDYRDCIWKWYAMNWLEEQDISLDEYLEGRMLSNTPDNYVHWKTFEEFISNDYLSVASTMSIIERFAATEEERETYKAFAAKDIVELRQKKSLEKMQENFTESKNEAVGKTYSFGIDVVAESRQAARKKLEELLRGLDEGEYFLRG